MDILYDRRREKMKLEQKLMKQIKMKHKNRTK